MPKGYWENKVTIKWLECNVFILKLILLTYSIQENKKKSMAEKAMCEKLNKIF